MAGNAYWISVKYIIFGIVIQMETVLLNDE